MSVYSVYLLMCVMWIRTPAAEARGRRISAAIRKDLNRELRAKAIEEIRSRLMSQIQRDNINSNPNLKPQQPRELPSRDFLPDHTPLSSHAHSDCVRPGVHPLRVFPKKRGRSAVMLFNMTDVQNTMNATDAATLDLVVHLRPAKRKKKRRGGEVPRTRVSSNNITPSAKFGASSHSLKSRRDAIIAALAAANNNTITNENNKIRSNKSNSKNNISNSDNYKSDMKTKNYAPGYKDYNNAPPSTKDTDASALSSILPAVNRNGRSISDQINALIAARVPIKTNPDPSDSRSQTILETLHNVRNIRRNSRAGKVSTVPATDPDTTPSKSSEQAMHKINIGRTTRNNRKGNHGNKKERRRRKRGKKVKIVVRSLNTDTGRKSKTATSLLTFKTRTSVTIPLPLFLLQPGHLGHNHTTLALYVSCKRCAPHVLMNYMHRHKKKGRKKRRKRRKKRKNNKKKDTREMLSVRDIRRMLADRPHLLIKTKPCARARRSLPTQYNHAHQDSLPRRNSLPTQYNHAHQDSLPRRDSLPRQDKLQQHDSLQRKALSVEITETLSSFSRATRHNADTSRNVLSKDSISDELGLHQGSGDLKLTNYTVQAFN